MKCQEAAEHRQITDVIPPHPLSPASANQPCACPPNRVFQVEMKRNVALRGQPTVVIQYNPHGDLKQYKPEDSRLMPQSNGSIIAVSYEARRFGVKRNMMAQEAKKLCPELKIVQARLI